MKHTFKSFLCLLLCLSLCLGFGVPALAYESAPDITYSYSLDKTTMTAGEEEIVTLTVTLSEPVSLAAISGYVFGYAPWGMDKNPVLLSVESGDARIDYTGCFDMETQILLWDGNENLDTFDNVTTIMVARFRMPADLEPAEYRFGMEQIVLGTSDAQEAARCYDSYNKPSHAVLTVVAASTDDPPVTPPPVVTGDGYVISLTTGTPSPVREEQVLVNVGITREGDDTFAAGELSVGFDKTKLSFNQADSTLGAAAVNVIDNADGTSTLKLADYGADKALSDTVYTLAFDTLAAGETSLTLADAGFSSKENAATEDLLPVSEEILEAEELPLEIRKKTFEVDLPAEFSGAAIATEGEDYVFTQANPHYDIDSVTFVFADGTEAKAQYDAETGAFVIPGSAITSAITDIRVEKTGVTYPVEFPGVQPASKPQAGPTYMTDYTFTLPADVASGTAAGKTYSAAATVDGVPVTLEASGQSRTIPGEMITGKVVITITETAVAATQVTVTVEDTTDNVVSQTSSPLNKGSDAVLVLKQEKGYVYTVTYTLGGGEAQTLTGVQNEDGNYVYTVENVQSNLVFTSSKTPDVSKVASAEYLTLNETTVWLITNAIELEEGSKATYDGADMFWSDRYNAYCYLVIAPADPLNTALVGIDKGQAPAVDYGMDVNKSGKVDASDAQLVYNMYQSAYEAFDETVTMEKFLRADVGGAAGIVDVNDAVTIINHILGIQSAETP